MVLLFIFFKLLLYFFSVVSVFVWEYFIFVRFFRIGLLCFFFFVSVFLVVGFVGVFLVFLLLLVSVIDDVVGVLFRLVKMVF